MSRADIKFGIRAAAMQKLQRLDHCAGARCEVSAAPWARTTAYVATFATQVAFCYHRAVSNILISILFLILSPFVVVVVCVVLAGFGKEVPEDIHLKGDRD